jgi:hypothetical protein
VNAAVKPNRSLLVSWLLGATVVALVTFSFEALSAREASPARCPASGTASASVTAHVPAPASPATTESGRCPATGTTGSTGTTARSTSPSARCPVTGATTRSATPSVRCPVTGATAQPADPSGRCPVGGNTSGLLRPGLRV